MDSKLLTELLSADGYIQVNKYLIKVLGLHEAILIGELVAEYRYWNNKNKLEDGKYFFATQENIEENTGLNSYMQRKALKNLQDTEVITIVKKGMPATNYFKINFEKLEEVLKNKSFKFSTSRPLKSEQLDVENLNRNNNNNKNKEIRKTISNDIVESEDSSVSFNFGSSKKSIKDNLYTKCINLINDFTEDEQFRKLLIEFLNARLQIKDKPFYPNNMKGILNKIQKWLDNGTAQETILEWVNYSIEKGYTTVYEQKSIKQRANSYKPKVNRNEQVEGYDELDMSVSY